MHVVHTVKHCLTLFKVKIKVTLEQAMKDQRKSSSTLSYAFSVDGGKLLRPRAGRFTLGNDPVTFVKEDGWNRGPIYTNAENFDPIGTRFPERYARNESLYRLSYADPTIFKVT
jgi:hypothetical protein